MIAAARYTHIKDRCSTQFHKLFVFCFLF